MSTTDLISLAIQQLRKEAMTPVSAIAGPPAPGPMPGQGMPPVDPAMAGAPPAGAPPAAPAAAGAPPADPAMAGVDPAAAGGMPMDPSMMDPSMMDPAMQGPDPIMELIELLKQIRKEVIQTRKIVAIVADTVQAKVPLNDLLEDEEDPLKGGSQGGGGRESTPKESMIRAESDGEASYGGTASEGVLVFDTPAVKFSAAAKLASAYFKQR